MFFEFWTYDELNWLELEAENEISNIAFLCYMT